MLSKTAIRKSVGRGKFTVGAFAEGTEVSTPTARRRLAELVSEGIVERLDDTEKVLDEDGEPQRGRPRHLYKVAKGK